MGRRVDQACDAFEAAWRAGRQPRLADYLGDDAEPARSALLRELIALDVIYRRRAGESPRPDDYHHHFHSTPPGWLAGVVKASAPAPPMVPGYEVLGEIARGGMGIVYKARHLALGRVVALKLIGAGEPASERAVRRFRQGARAASALDHPGIVPIYEIGDHQGRHYLSMALVEGPTLQEWVRRHGTPPPHQARAILTALADAVEFAHRRGVLHRDLKPDNVLLQGSSDSDPRPRIADFGLARRLEEDGLTLTGQILGTPAYMAPEQATGRRRQVGPATDVYGLGGILYFLLTGRAPFQAPNVAELLLDVVGRPVVLPREVNPAVPPDLEAVCLRCLEKDPARRYPSAAALAEALCPTEAATGRRWQRPGRVELLIGAAALLGLATALLLLLLD
jgi:serine/threonine protein kinase